MGPINAGLAPTLSPAVVVIVGFLLAGCHSHKRIAIPGASPTPTQTDSKPVQQGDLVRATLVDGVVVTFRVAEVTPDALVATDGRRILFRDIASLDQKRLAKTRTVALVVGVGVAAFFLVAWIAFLNWDGDFL